MTSAERREARYRRRVLKREAKRKEKLAVLGGYDDVFTYENLYNSFYQCRVGVRWKKSVQIYEALLLLLTLKIYFTLLYRKFKPCKFLEFDLMERGKLRHIRAVELRERCIQRVLCDLYLIPRIRPKLIYDNGASVKGKGTSFSINRMKTHLHRHFRKYGSQGYIFQYDFSSYFDNIDHTILLKMLDEVIEDPDVFYITAQMILCFGDKGLGLGSQVSQICAVWYPTIIDKYFKEVLGIKGYGRYNDDGYAICRTLHQAKECQAALVELCDQLHITINPKKMKICKLDNTFVFLKKRFTLTDTGKVIVKIDKSGVTRARRRLKKLATKINTERFTLLDFNQSYRSWVGAAKHYDNDKIIQSYKSLYHKLLKEYDCRDREVDKNDVCLRIRKNQFYVEDATWSRRKACLHKFSSSIT